MGTKFKINQEVWVMFANLPALFKINTIVIRPDSIEYWFTGIFDKDIENGKTGFHQDFYRTEEKCFKSKEELLASF